MLAQGRRVEIRGKNALVVGLARSGVGAANLLLMSGAAVTVTDRKSEGELEEYVRQLSPDVKRCLGGYPQSLNDTDFVVISPGVPLTIEPLVKAHEKGIKIIGEFELAYQIINSRFNIQHHRNSLLSRVRTENLLPRHLWISCSEREVSLPFWAAI